MAVVFMMRRGNKLLICEKEMVVKDDTELTVGFPLFKLEAKGLLSGEGDDIKKMMGVMEENKSYKMVLKQWPIE